MANDDLLLGIETARAGNVQQARAHLARVVQMNRASEDGWLWLGHLPALNPKHAPARAALIALQSGPTAIAPLKELLFPNLDQVLGTVNLLHQGKYHGKR